MRSRDVLKLLNFHYHYVYGHQTCQCSDIAPGAPTHKVIWSFVIWFCDLVKSREKLNTFYLHLQKIYGHQTNESGDLLWQPLKSHDLKLITWWIEKIMSPLMITELGRVLNSRGGSERKRLSRHQLLVRISGMEYNIFTTFRIAYICGIFSCKTAR